MHDTVKEWVEIVTACAAALGVGIAIVVALVQAHLQWEQRKLDLFDKRFAVYHAVRELLELILEERRDTHITRHDVVSQFLQQWRFAKFLFGPEITDFLQMLHGSIETNGMGPLKRYDVTVSMDRFLEWSPLAEELFAPYLQIHHSKRWLLRLKDQIDDWMTGLDRTMQSRREVVDR